MQEIFKDIVGYEGLYQVSNLGNVKSLPRTKKAKKNSVSFLKERILKFHISIKGYYSVPLCKDSKELRYMVHRLVALAFIPNTNNKQQVNHINGIKTDNRVENLEWCTQAENQIHACKLDLKAKKITNEQVLAIRNDTRLQSIIAKEYNVSQPTISAIKNGHSRFHI